MSQAERHHGPNNHELHEAAKLAGDLRHHHFNAAREELAKELHHHPKEFNQLLKAINHDLHGKNKVELKHGKHGAYLDFAGHDIYDMHHSGHPKPHSASEHHAKPGKEHGHKSRSPVRAEHPVKPEAPAKPQPIKPEPAKPDQPQKPGGDAPPPVAPATPEQPPQGRTSPIELPPPATEQPPQGRTSPIELPPPATEQPPQGRTSPIELPLPKAS